MEIKTRVYKNALYVSLCGELDEHSALYTRETLDNILDKEEFKQVIVDLNELEFMDSTGIGVMIGRYKKLKNQDIPLYLTNPNKHIDKIFEMTGLYKIMPKLV
ncbi:MAG: anti-sigma factor antagonist [Christensenellales bacterium]